MEPSGEVNKFMDKLIQRTRDENQVFLEKFDQELARLNESCMKELKSVLATTEVDINKEIIAAQTRIKNQSKILSFAFGREWLRTALLTVAVLTGMALTSWFVMSGLTLHKSQELERLLQIKAEILYQKETLSLLEKKTFGLILSETAEGKFIVLPRGTKIQTGWTMGEKDAIRLE